MTTYIAAEPNCVEAYKDDRGRLHATREDAIYANFDFDLHDAVSRICVKPGRFAEMPFPNSVALIKCFVAENPDMVRVLLGDRDAT